MEFNLIIVLVTILASVEVGSGARILGVFPIPSISHQVVYRALVTELARRGHHVTVITPDPITEPDVPSDNYKQIDVHDLSYGIWQEIFNFAELRGASDEPKNAYPAFKDALLKIFDAQLETAEVQAIIKNETEQFDLIILESLVRPNFGFAWRFQVPLIGISSLSGLLPNFDAVGNPSHPILYPDIFRTKAGNLNIWEKICTVYSDLWLRNVESSFLERDDGVVRKHFGADAPSLTELETRMDMLFVNVHPMLAGIRPAVPAVVYMGGLHLKPKKKLPEELQKFLDDSPQGVVYMSLGSNVMSKDLPSEVKQMLLGVFSRLPYRVLWKFEEDLSGLPSNVRVARWLPQQDLLGHPNIKAFITQGGQQSMEEAIRDNVPLVGIPFIGDQDLNVQNFVLHGIGVRLDFNTLNKEDFEKAIMTVSTDPKYKENIKRLSALLSDQPMTSLERAVWWTEYVLRHRGAAHLRAPAVGLPLAEYYLLDVAAALAAMAAAAALLLAGVTALVYWLLCGGRGKAKMQ